jgi:hypothetical protein
MLIFFLNAELEILDDDNCYKSIDYLAVFYGRYLNVLVYTAWKYRNTTYSLLQSLFCMKNYDTKSPE